MAKRRRSGKPGCQGNADFFTVFVPHINSRKLMIPPDFIKDFSRTIQEKVILKDIGGKKSWTIDVAKTRDGVFLKNGWEKFVSDNRLKVGEFLVFCYDGSYSFVVKIFDINGCKRESFDKLKIDTHVKIEQNTEEKEVETKPKRARVVKEDHSSRANERGLNEEKLKYIDSENRENNMGSVPPIRPYYVSPPMQAKQYHLRIPIALINEHNLHFEPQMVLRTENGKEWRVSTYINNGRRIIGRGFFTFLKENNVGFKDRCKYTFHTDRLSNTIDVQILSASENRDNST